MSEQGEANSDSDLSISFSQEQFNRIYTNELRKQEKQKESLEAKMTQNEGQGTIYKNERKDDQEGEKDGIPTRSDNAASLEEDKEWEGKNENPPWHIYDACESLRLQKSRFSSYVLNLPIYKKKEEILNYIINNQVVLITGETGCGKSTQVPRLIYEYIRETKLPAKIICVQPRRLAVKNLHKLLSQQIPEKDAVGYHIAMQTYNRPETKILFMTNGIFLQRLVHSTQFFQNYPFIVLDEVHERDIDTDFILLSIKRMLRRYPKIRVILMSATIDNKLFQYYFAEDEIDNFMKRENFYKRFIKIEAQTNKRKDHDEEDNGYNIERIGEDEELYQQIQMEYLKSKFPCPTVNVTEKGKYKKEYFYLDTMRNFFQRSHSMKWGSVSFFSKSPTTSKEIYQSACELLEEITNRAPKDKSNESTLIFLPGLGQIEFMVSQMQQYFGKRVENFELIKCHSSILNDETTKKLHTMYRQKFKVIIATNIAESSITVFGIKYIIDFCLSKEVNFNQKSRMQNLQLVWASKASCQQRAGRTGRVCDGLVFRMVEKEFYQKLAEYSTPEIQRSSLDKLILRIKLIHDNEKSGNAQIFEDPGEVLGTAIQPPNLKHIDEAIKSLVLCGGLRVENDKLILTKLGRIYVDIPLDIIYCKMLIFSMIMGTYEDMLVLVCILSQNKNAFRKNAVEKFPLEYFNMMSNDQRCDFVALIKAFRDKEKNYRVHYRDRRHTQIDFDIYYEVDLLIKDVSRRIKKRNLTNRVIKNESLEDHEEKFKMTIAFGFLSNLIKVSSMIYDDRQEKRYKLMKKQGITVRNTIVLLNSDSIRKSANQNEEADLRMKKNWIQNISNAFRIKAENMTMTLGQGLSFLHFKEELDLNQFLFIKFMEKKRGMNDDRSKSNSKVVTLNQILPHLGDIDYMEEGNPSELFKDHKVNIDSFSINRVVAVNKQNESFEFPTHRLLITNSITQQSSRLSARYASLLPDISNLQTILHMVFYPFVSLLPDKKRTKYDSLYLKKRTKLHISYELSDEEISQANQIRGILKELMELDLFLQDESHPQENEAIPVTEDGCFVEDQDEEKDKTQQNKDSEVLFANESIMTGIQKKAPTNSTREEGIVAKREYDEVAQKNERRKQKMISFWPLLKAYLLKERRPVLQQQKWQELYYQQKKICQKSTAVKFQKEDEKQFMNPIRTLDLKYNFFSSNFDSQNSREERCNDYVNWKIAKYKEVTNLQQIANDHDPYIVCSVCQVKIAKMNKIGPINNLYFREVFDYIEENLKPLAYNELGDYFCSMLMTIYTEKEYDVYGCKNDHILALKFKQQRRIKILTFSPISILFTDGSYEEQPEFQYFEYRKWRERFEISKVNKLKKAQQNYCFVCGDKFKTIREVEAHIKTPYHEANMRDFRSTIPEAQRGISKEKVSDAGGY